jgi:hypothetical protein
MSVEKKVLLKVKTGTIGFEDGTFQRGETFAVSESRAALFDQADIEYIAQPEPTITATVEPTPTVAEVEAKPLPKTSKKAKPIEAESDAANTSEQA